MRLVLLTVSLARRANDCAEDGPDEPGQNSSARIYPRKTCRPWRQRQKGNQYIRLWGPDVWDRTPIRELVTELTK